MLIDICNAGLTSGIFSACCNVARLVLIGKEKWFSELPLSYQELSILETAGHVSENQMKSRLLAAIQSAGSFSPRQYGLGREKSIVDAIL